MLKNRLILVCGFALLLVAFAFGVTELVQLRLDQGDVYPPYSSLRADALGARGLYESLDQLRGFRARRLYEPLSKVGGGNERTLFVLGTRVSDLRYVSQTDAKDLQDFLSTGGRMVISLFPEVQEVSWRPGRHKTKKGEAQEGETKKKEKPGSKTSRKSEPDRRMRRGAGDEEVELSSVSLMKEFGFDIGYEDLLVDDDGSTRPALAHVKETNSVLPRLISWHSASYFSDLDTRWRTVYSREKHPVIIEKQFGRGTLVLCSDSFFLSNEALRKERHAELLAWLVGPNRQMIFDETHLGVSEDPGVATLMRQYGLSGLVGALLLLAGLFIWKNGSSFVPPLEEAGEGQAGVVLGKDAASGFVNLLRRSISPSEVLSVCFTEWKKSCGQRGGPQQARIAAMERICAEEVAQPAGSRNPVEAYRAMIRVLKQRK